MKCRKLEKGSGNVVQFVEGLPIMYRTQRLIPAL